MSDATPVSANLPTRIDAAAARVDAVQAHIAPEPSFASHPALLARSNVSQH